MTRLILGILVLATLTLICLSSGKKVCKKPVLSKNLISKIRHKKKNRENAFVAGSKIFFKCKKGFVLFGKNKIKCKRNGLWTHNPPSCADAKIECPVPEPIANGTVTASRRVLSNANYKCIEDYEIIGRNKRKCQPSGKWAGEPPKCQKKRCKRPRMLSLFKNGKYVIENSNFDIWSSITFDCNDGYYIPREDSMTCTKDGTWQPRRVPKCYPINCGDPGRPKNGRRFGSQFNVGKKVEYYCNYGYTLIGSKERTCQSDFTWSGEQAICDSKKYDCPDPGIPSHGRRIGDRFDLGDQVKYLCVSGYTLRGSEVRKCKRNGTWTGLPAECEDETKVIIPPLNQTVELFQNNVIDKLAPVTCSSNKDGKCNYPKYRGRAINLNHPNGLDLIFLFDSSTSIGQKSFKHALEFACYLIQELGIDHGIGGTRIAAITFSTKATIAYNLEDERVNTVKKACKLTRSIRYSGGGTGTTFGLRLALKEVKPLFLEGSNRALILIADGKSNFGGSPESAARALRKHNVEIFVIGVGKKVNKIELGLIATDKNHIYQLGKYDDFRTMTETMVQRDYSKCGEGGVISRARILGGEISSSRNGTQWPWQVAIYKFNGKYHQHVCGGSLIRDNVILTAAHCMLNSAENGVDTLANKFRVVVGELKIILGPSEEAEMWLEEKAFRVKKIFIHQQYKPGFYTDDISIFELKKPVEWSPKVRPVCVPEPHHNVQEKIHGYATGWGNTANIAKGERHNKSDELRYVFLPVQSNKTCGLVEGRKNKMFCAGYAAENKDACQGDSGGPFVVKYADDEIETKFSFKIMGIVSHGPECGTKDEFGFYTRVTNYLGWIKKTIAEMKEMKKGD